MTPVIAGVGLRQQASAQALRQVRGSGDHGLERLVLDGQGSDHEGEGNNGITHGALPGHRERR